MKRDFLKSLGIEDKEIIDKILDENSADIGRAKGDLDDIKSNYDKLQIQFDKLKESTKDYDDLSSKVKQLELDNSQLTTDKKQLEIDLDMKVSQILKNHAIENSVRDSKAKNTKAVMALLDVEKITYKDGELSGISEQLEALKSGEDTSFLFGDVQGAPSGTHFNNPPSGGNGGTPPTSKTFAEAIAKAITNK